MTAQDNNFENTFESGQTGLSDIAVRDALNKFGYNEIPEEHTNSLKGVLRRLWGPIPWILEMALILEIALGKLLQGSIIVVLLIFSAIIGELQERRARKALNFLKQNIQVRVRVVRNSKWQFLMAKKIVPQDYIHLKAGDIVPADCIVIKGALELDQSSVTGESASVSYNENENIYSGSVVRSGEALVKVAATGSSSYFGKTAELVKTASAPGHLEKILFSVVRYLAVIDLFLAAVLLISAIINGLALLPLLPFFIVLVIATVPISMPASFTVANALEARSLAKEGVLVTGLTALQEAASIQVLCVDKTGTLTENRPVLSEITALSTETENEVLRYAAACCDSSSLNPVDIAILKEIKNRNIQPLNRQEFMPFNPVNKFSQATVSDINKVQRIILGSPMVMEQYTSSPQRINEVYHRMAKTGNRVLAVAVLGEENTRICGLLSLADYPRKDAFQLVQTIKGMGVKIIMITGDTAMTAQAIGEDLAIGNRAGTLDQVLQSPMEYDSGANIYPEDKYQIIKSLQQKGLITAMTGDGMNDAPALKQAEIGIAVKDATDVAKASAKVILTQPGLSDIIKVIQGGMKVYRRMLTWTITKISRTIELSVLLTAGYILTEDFVIPLNLIVLVVVFNDLVTITLGTDRAAISQKIEQWDMKRILKISGIFALGWTTLGVTLIYLMQRKMNVPMQQIQTYMFLYLIFSAQLTIYCTRVKNAFWKFWPSRMVIAVTTGNIIISAILASAGILMQAVPLAHIVILFTISVMFTVLLDYLKILFYRRKS